MWLQYDTTHSGQVAIHLHSNEKYEFNVVVTNM